jgi:hypothetical protein
MSVNKHGSHTYTYDFRGVSNILMTVWTWRFYSDRYAHSFTKISGHVIEYMMRKIKPQI